MEAPTFTTSLLLVYFAVVTQSQPNLLVVWNNTTISRDPDIPDPRVLIYHDEINIRTATGFIPDGDGVLVCRHSKNPRNVEWLQPRGTPIPSNNVGDFRTIERAFTAGPSRSQLARVVQTPSTAGNEGLWSCNGGGLRRYVSLYRRGNGVISNVAVSLQSSSFGSNRFTLAADTTGGPPTTFSWRRNGGSALQNNSVYRISNPVADPSNNQNDRENCRYRSTIQVTGVLPGVYEYQATNRATSVDVATSFTVEGEAPSNLQVAQTGIDMVEVSWTPPQGTSPARGYQVVDSENNINTHAVPDSNSLMIDMLPPGFYSFRVISYSQHFPGREAGPVTIAVRGAFPPVITLSQLTATSVNVSWTQPMFNFPAMNYTVTIQGLISCCVIPNIRGLRNQDANNTTAVFQGLEKYTNYRVEVTVNFQSIFAVSQETAAVNFTTLGIAPSDVPSNLSVFTVTSRAIGVTWDAVDCGRENGPNFRYEVEFRQADGGALHALTANDKLFTVVEDLQPSTDYEIRVRGVNDIGHGKYTDSITIQTHEDSNVPVAVSVSVVVSVLLTIILYSALLLVGCCITRAYCNKPSKKITNDTDGGVAMKENAAYDVPVTSSQQPQDNEYAQPGVKLKVDNNVEK